MEAAGPNDPLRRIKEAYENRIKDLEG